MKTFNLVLFLSTVAGASCFTNSNLQRTNIGIISAKSFHPHQTTYSSASSLSSSSLKHSATTFDRILNNSGDDGKAPSTDKKTSFPIALWKFTRPHTLIGSALAIPSLHMLAAPSFAAAFSTPNLHAALFAMIPSLLMNLYITGLNQITDVEIDRINKPNLPLVTGEMSKKTAIVTVIVALILSIALSLSNPALSSNGLNVALWGSGILGTMYSLEPFRLKRFPLLAAFCIVAVRGTIINAGFFAHARQAAFGVSGATVANCLTGDLTCQLSSLFFGVFGIVIALMKDVPDVRGDAQANIRTLSVRIGQKRIFHSMRRLLTGLFFVYGAGFAKGAMTAPSTLLSVCRGGVAAASICAGFSVRKESQTVDPEDPKEVYGFYMHLWKLFYLSYLALPFVR